MPRKAGIWGWLGISTGGDDELRWGKYKLSDVIGVVGGITGLATGLFVYAQGQLWQANLEFHGPEQVELRCYPRPDDKCTEESQVTVTAMALTYINTGNPAKTPFVSRESVTAYLPGQTVELNWNWFANIGDETEGQTAAVEFAVGADGAAHETQFLPRVLTKASAPDLYDNYYGWRLLMSKVAASHKDGKPVHIKFVFNSQVVGESTPRTATCDIDIDPETVTIWMTPWNNMFNRRFPCEV